LVGALVLARAVNDPKLSDDILRDQELAGRLTAQVGWYLVSDYDSFGVIIREADSATVGPGEAGAAARIDLPASPDPTASR
jgi:hypothetical protein